MIQAYQYLIDGTFCGVLSVADGTALPPDCTTTEPGPITPGNVHVWNGEKWGTKAVSVPPPVSLEPQEIPTTVFIGSGDGYVRVQVGSQQHIDLLALPAESRPSIFDAKSKEVIAYQTTKAKEAATNAITDFIASTRLAVAGTKDGDELSGYTNKKIIAERIVARTASALDISKFLTEIEYRGEGETLPEFTTKVLRNAEFYGEVVSILDGAKKRALKAVSQATDANTAWHLVDECRETVTNGIISLKRKLGIPV